jgi:hypothetical protein
MPISLPRIVRITQVHDPAALAVEQKLAVGNLTPAELHQAHQRQRRDRLSRAGFANDADGFARHDLEADILDPGDRTVLGLELHTQVADCSNGLIQHGHPSPVLFSVRRSGRPFARHASAVSARLSNPPLAQTAAGHLPRRHF